MLLEQVLEKCRHKIEKYYTDNEKECQGDANYNAFVKPCRECSIKQGVTMIKNPETNGNV